MFVCFTHTTTSFSAGLLEITARCIALLNQADPDRWEKRSWKRFFLRVRICALFLVLKSESLNTHFFFKSGNASDNSLKCFLAGRSKRWVAYIYMCFFYAINLLQKDHGLALMPVSRERENLDRLTLSRYVFNLSCWSITDLAAVSACIPSRIVQ
jgi:hypothetical protein